MRPPTVNVSKPQLLLLLPVQGPDLARAPVWQSSGGAVLSLECHNLSCVMQR